MASALIKVERGLYITPVAPVVDIGEKVALRAMGGAGRLSWGYTDGELTEREGETDGSLSDEVEFSAGRSGRFLVWVRDEQGALAQVVVRVVSSALAISPGQAEVRQGEATTFRVKGGTGPYAWSASHGTLSTDSGDFVVWRAPDTIPKGDVMITVEDGMGRQQVARVRVAPRDEPSISVKSNKDEFRPGDEIGLEVKIVPILPPDEAMEKWDVYMAIFLPDGKTFVGLSSKDVLLEPGRLLPYKDNDGDTGGGHLSPGAGSDGAIFSGRWIRVFTFVLPSGTVVPEGRYTFIAALSPKGMDIYEAAQKGAILYDMKEFQLTR